MDRRKKGSKHHLATDAAGTPLAAEVTAANVNDVTRLIPLVDAIPPVRGKPGAPRHKPGEVMGDRAYHDEQRRTVLRGRGIVPVIARRGDPHGSGFGVLRYVVEQTIALLHQFRRLRNRFDKRDDIHQTFLTIGCAVICWRRLHRLTG